MRVFLTNSYKNNRLSCSVHHIQCCPNFVVHRIEFSHYNTINYSRILLLNCKVNQWLVELCKLVNWVVPYQCFTYKQDNIRLVDVDKFCESFHQRLISLHSSSSVNQDNIVFLAFCILNCFFGNDSRIVFVAFVIQGNFKALSMSHQLLNSSWPEIVTSCQHNTQITFCFQIIAHFSKRSGFSNSIHTNKNNAIYLAFLFGSQSFF